MNCFLICLSHLTANSTKTLRPQYFRCARQGRWQPSWALEEHHRASLVSDAFEIIPSGAVCSRNKTVKYEPLHRQSRLRKSGGHSARPRQHDRSNSACNCSAYEGVSGIAHSWHTCVRDHQDIGSIQNCIQHFSHASFLIRRKE